MARVNTRFVSAYLDTVGDGTGTKNAVMDCATTATTVFLAPGATQIFEIQKLVVTVQDTTIVDNPLFYGGHSAALVNGITIKKLVGASTVVEDFTDELPVKKNADWERYGRVTPVELTQTCTQVQLKCVIDFGEYSGAAAPGVREGLRLDGSNAERLSVGLNDDFTTTQTITAQYFLAQGRVIQ